MSALQNMRDAAARADLDDPDGYWLTTAREWAVVAIAEALTGDVSDEQSSVTLASGDRKVGDDVHLVAASELSQSLRWVSEDRAGAAGLAQLDDFVGPHGGSSSLGVTPETVDRGGAS